MLVQNRDNLIVTAADLKIVSKRQPTEQEIRALLFAWKVCKHVKSNAIIFARRISNTVGVGAGQMNRVDSVRIAAMRAERFDFAAEKFGSRFRRVFPVPRQRGRSREIRHRSDYSAGRLGQRLGSHRSRRRTRFSDGLYRHTTFQTLIIPVFYRRSAERTSIVIRRRFDSVKMNHSPLFFETFQKMFDFFGSKGRIEINQNFLLERSDGFL